jgi:aryl-alcohol dehydrogenase-like predicted oxidoreductase
MGEMQLAGDWVFRPPRDRDEALQVLRAAVAAGVDHIDTAQYHGVGTGNELFREALFPHPDGLAIVSKVAAAATSMARRWCQRRHLPPTGELMNRRTSRRARNGLMVCAILIGCDRKETGGGISERASGHRSVQV